MAKRKILCLHGAMLSSEIFQMQLAPYQERLEKEHNCTFTYVNAPVKTDIEPSIRSFYDGPCFRYFQWAPSKIKFSMDQIRAGYLNLYKVLKEQGPFDGVMGFSQGAVMSIALMLHHAETHPQDPPNALFKFGIYFSTPFIPDLETDKSTVKWGRIGIPSLHITGQDDDEWHEYSKEIVEDHCEEGTATLIVHRGAHVVPKDEPTVEKVLKAIGNLIETTMAS